MVFAGKVIFTFPAIFKFMKQEYAFFLLEKLRKGMIVISISLGSLCY